MSKPVYKEAYKEYVEYCKNNNKEPYKLNSLKNLVYKYQDVWNLTAEEKVKCWYKLFKTRIDNTHYKYKEEREYYNKYKEEKVLYSSYIYKIRQGISKEEAIKKQLGNKSTYYRDNIDKAQVELQVFISRTNLGWSFEKALTIPKMKPGIKIKKDLKNK